MKTDFALKNYNRRARLEHLISECLAWLFCVALVLFLAVDKEQVISWMLFLP